MPMRNTKDVTVPKDNLIVYKDYYWLCEEGKPQNACFFGSSPQCNKDKRVAEMVLNNCYADAKCISIIFIEIAYVPIRNSICGVNY